MTSRLFFGLLIAVALTTTSHGARHYYKYEGEMEGNSGGDDGGMNGGEVRLLMEMFSTQDEGESQEMVCARIAAKLELINERVIPVGIFITTSQFLPITRSTLHDYTTIVRFALAANIEVAEEDINKLAEFLLQVLREELIDICDLELTATIEEAVFMIADFLKELFAANASIEVEEMPPMKKKGSRRVK